MSSRFLTTHNTWDMNLVLPFVVDTQAPGEIYVDPIWGIRIVRVTADGQPVTAGIYDIDLDDVSFSTLQTGGLPFIYRIRFEDFFLARTFTDTDWILERYELPRAARQILIEYQLRKPGESPGPVLTLESRLL